MTQKDTTLRSIQELMSKKIVTAEGKTIGHVFDIQLSRDGEHRVIALMYGEKSLLYRLHVYESVARAFRFKQKPKTIPWEAVESFDDAAVHLKQGYEVEYDVISQS